MLFTYSNVKKVVMLIRVLMNLNWLAQATSRRFQYYYNGKYKLVSFSDFRYQIAHRSQIADSETSHFYEP